MKHTRQAVAGGKGPPVPLFLGQKAELKSALIRRHSLAPKMGARGWGERLGLESSQ